MSCHRPLWTHKESCRCNEMLVHVLEHKGDVRLESSYDSSVTAAVSKATEQQTTPSQGWPDTRRCKPWTFNIYTAVSSSSTLMGTVCFQATQKVVDRFAIRLVSLLEFVVGWFQCKHNHTCHKKQWSLELDGIEFWVYNNRPQYLSRLSCLINWCQQLSHPLAISPFSHCPIVEAKRDITSRLHSLQSVHLQRQWV